MFDEANMLSILFSFLNAFDTRLGEYCTSCVLIA